MLVELYSARGAWNELLDVYQKQTLTVETGANQADLCSNGASSER